MFELRPKDLFLVVGLGQTGLSCVRYLSKKNVSIAVADSRQNPPQLNACHQGFPDVPISLGKFSETFFSTATTLVVSPGVSLDEPVITACRKNGIEIIGDIELFVREAKAPIIAVTGSNGKSTVVTLLGKMIDDAGLKSIVCGNIGRVALDCLNEPLPDYYVLELSSFQLEITFSLSAKVAVVLNVSYDHLDRHADFKAYIHAKKRIYKNCETAVVNVDEKNLWNDLAFSKSPVCFTLKSPAKGEWGLQKSESEIYLAHGEKKLIATSELILQSRHNYQNMLAALAIGNAINLPMPSMLNSLKMFTGLPHRCQLVKISDGVAWYNDSKATNVGASIAAITSIGAQVNGQLFLIAGGDSKGVSLEALKEPIRSQVSHVILLGKDADKLEQALSGCARISHVSNMKSAVAKAAKFARSGDTILLSPACSSLDMYTNFVARGDDFVKAVEAIK